MTTSSREIPGLWSEYYAPDFRVRVDGEELAPETKGDVLQIAVTLDEKQPASFSVTVSDWDDAALAFKYSSTTTFDPGRKLSVELGYAGRLVRVVSGVVTSLSPRFPESGAPTLTVGGQDVMRQMANRELPAAERKLYRNKTDWEIAQEIAARWDLRAEVTRKGPRHPLVSQRQNDAAFLAERAKRIDFEFYVDADRSSGEQVLHFVERRDGRDSTPIQVYRFDWGVNLMSFAPRLTTNDQVREVTVRGWDPDTKQPIVYTARASDLPSSAASARNGPARADRRAVETIVDVPVFSLDEARNLAISRLMERANRFTQGSAQAIGLPDLRPGDNVDITGVGDRFSGRYHVTKVSHAIGGAGFTTTIEVGRPIEGPTTGRSS
jgi:phage protein D